METQHYTIHIDAPREKVWNVMLDDATYRQWTEPFHPGSYYEGDWRKGSKILFIGPGENGQTGGMVSTIVENIPHEFISIKHIGVVENGVEVTSGEAIKGWAGALENYTFKDAENGGTDLIIDVDTDPKYSEMFNAMWPKALIKLKEIAEK